MNVLRASIIGVTATAAILASGAGLASAASAAPTHTPTNFLIGTCQTNGTYAVRGTISNHETSGNETVLLTGATTGVFPTVGPNQVRTIPTFTLPGSTKSATVKFTAVWSDKVIVIQSLNLTFYGCTAKH